MIVQKVLNNSLVLSMDDDNREVIVMGKGIGFN
ncbi:TPA: CAT RNA binding domain-containing protein, partial [Klebsiella michiganensis]